eukprot:UN04876
METQLFITITMPMVTSPKIIISLLILHVHSHGRVSISRMRSLRVAR